MIDTKDIKHILIINYDLHHKAGAAGNRFDDITECFIFTGLDILKVDEVANNKIKEISRSVKKVNSWNLFINYHGDEIPIIDVSD